MIIKGMVKMEGEYEMRVGYIRVSTIEQNEARQFEALEKHGIDKWFTEKLSGKNTDRPMFRSMMDFVREGDSIYVMDFSRLSRSTKDLLNIIEQLKIKGVRLISLKENLDTNTPQGKLMLTVIAAINEFERQNMLERQREGIAIAKREGHYKGRKPKLLENFKEVYELWENGNITAINACKTLGISRSGFYQRVRSWRKQIDKIKE